MTYIVKKINTLITTLEKQKNEHRELYSLNANEQDTITLNGKLVKLKKILKENEDFGKAKESDIIRDLIFILQGVNGKYIKFSFIDNSYCIQPSVFY